MNLVCCTALEDHKLIPGAETPRCFVEAQATRRSCLDDSPLANAQSKEGHKRDLDLPSDCCKDLQTKDLLAPLANANAFPMPHEALPGPAASFEGPIGDLKFEPDLVLHGTDGGHTGGGLDAPIIRLDGTSGLPHLIISQLYATPYA